MTTDTCTSPWSESPDAHDLRSLRYAEHFCIWAMRTSVACSPKCRTLLREFESAFGRRAPDGLTAWYHLLQALGEGARKVCIGRPGHIQLTHDELCIARMLGAAQTQDQDRFMAHARWIMAHNRLDRLYDDARRFTGLMRERGHICALPGPCANTAGSAKPNLMAI